MAKTKKKWIDGQGNQVPLEYISKSDKNAERITRKYLRQAQALNERLAKLKQDMLDECDKYYIDMLAEHHIKDKKTKGNFSVTSFDKEVKIEVNVQDRVEFSDLIDVAQQKINEFIEEKTAGIDNELQQLIAQAFQTNKGRLDVKRVLGLFKLNIKHKKWIEAMEIIKKSINRNHSKRYVRVWRRGANGEYVSVDLNFSSI